MRFCNLNLPLGDSHTADVNKFLVQVGLIMNGQVRIFPKEITFYNSAQKANFCYKFEEEEFSSCYGLVSEVHFYQRVATPSLYLVTQQYV